MAGPLGCRSVFSLLSDPQEGSRAAKGAAPLLPGDSEAASRKERTLFCLHTTYTDKGGAVHVKAVIK